MFCEWTKCYHNSYYSLKLIELQPIILTSRMLLTKRRTSIFQKVQFFIYLNGSIKPRNTTLSKASFEDMLSQKADKLTKELTTDDLLDGVIFPIFARKKVAFNCVEPSQLIVDDQQMTCDIGTFQFIDNPKTIILATEP